MAVWWQFPESTQCHQNWAKFSIRIVSASNVHRTCVVHVWFCVNQYDLFVIIHGSYSLWIIELSIVIIEQTICCMFSSFTNTWSVFNICGRKITAELYSNICMRVTWALLWLLHFLSYDFLVNFKGSIMEGHH